MSCGGTAESFRTPPSQSSRFPLNRREEAQPAPPFKLPLKSKLQQPLRRVPRRGLCRRRHAPDYHSDEPAPDGVSRIPRGAAS